MYIYVCKCIYIYTYIYTYICIPGMDRILQQSSAQDVLDEGGSHTNTHKHKHTLIDIYPCIYIHIFVYICIPCIYQAWMGFYNSHLRKMNWTKEDLVREANDLALNCWNLRELPQLEAKTVGKMGLKGVPGLNISRGGNGGGFGGGGRGGGGFGGDRKSVV